MTKTEAAKMVALNVRAWARKYGTDITPRMCADRISELNHESYAGTYIAEAAAVANYRTVYRLATANPL